jgi:hypothetical protein
VFARSGLSDKALRRSDSRGVRREGLENAVAKGFEEKSGEDERRRWYVKARVIDLRKSMFLFSHLYCNNPVLSNMREIGRGIAEKAAEAMHQAALRESGTVPEDLDDHPIFQIHEEDDGWVDDETGSKELNDQPEDTLELLKDTYP